MAKTYEAFVKYRGKSGKPDLPSDSVLEIPSPDLSSDKQMVDLNYMIDMRAKQDNLKLINFVSSHSGEGTTTVVVNFVRFMIETKASRQVLLIDANLLHPSLHLEFNIPPKPGLNDVLWNKAKLSDAIFKLGSSNIYLVPGGSSLSFDPSNIELQRYSTIFSHLSSQFKYVFIDSPPLFDSSIALALASIADTTFFVVQAHRTQWEVALKAKEYLGHYKCDIGGVILNRVQQPIPEWLYGRL